MATIDLKKLYQEHYKATAAPAVVELPPRRFLMIDGAGDPNVAEEYRDAIQTLYPLAYGIRSAVKSATGDAYVVMPLEGLWWAEDMTQFDVADKSSWLWTAMICLPDAATPDITDPLILAISAEKRLASGHKARVEQWEEGLAVQVRYLGPYSDEGPTIAKLHAFIKENDFELRGKHHEIYLSDPRKVDPGKLRTIIRQAVSPTIPQANGARN